METLKSILQKHYDSLPEVLDIEESNGQKFLRVKLTDEIKDGYVYDNGWYKLQTSDGYALYRADGSLVNMEREELILIG